MKFRVRSKEGDLIANAFLAQDGKVYCEGLLGFEEIKGAKPDFLVGYDANGKEVFEGDVLVDDYNSYTAGLDLDMGAVLIYKDTGKIPLKQSVSKLFLKEKQ